VEGAVDGGIDAEEGDDGQVRAQAKRRADLVEGRRDAFAQGRLDKLDE
jgi:hypothetical protein